jgi:hypothetical protein
MLSYGASKLIPSQFPPPSLTRMLETYGESSPMGLLWTFMGASGAYTTFTGAAEALSGILLLCPATVTLGALISLAVTTNIVMLNMSYDVPVKILSSHLFVAALVVLSSQFRRLIDFFILNRKVEPASDPLFKRKSWNRVALILQTIFGIYVFGQGLYGSYFAYQEFVGEASKSKYYGIWTATEFSVDGTSAPPLITDGARWNHVIFDRNKALILDTMNGSKRWFKEALSDNDQMLTLTKWQDKKWTAQFRITPKTTDQILLDGTKDGQHIHAVLDRMNDSKMLLQSRGFNWINEHPFNR